MPTGIELARHYKARGFAPLPVALGTKECRLPDWPNRIFADEELPQHFLDAPQNVAILTGDASGRLVDIDLDCAEAIRLAGRFLPQTNSKFGRQSKPASHWLYRVDDPQGTQKFTDPTGGGVIAEYRANRSCTVMPGSIHPSGEEVRFDQDGEPTGVDRNELLASLKTLVAASAFARHWPPGNRHDAALSLAGFLLTRGYDPMRAESFITSVCELAADDELNDRLECIRTTHERMQQGERITNALARYFNPQIAHQALFWLPDLNHGGRELLAAPRVEELSPEGVVIYSDLANAKRFQKMHSDAAAYCPEIESWIVWDGTRWAEDKSGRVRHLAIETVKAIALDAAESGRREQLLWAAKSQSARALRDMVTVAQSGAQISASKLDHDPWALNCRNGTLNLKTGVLRAHDPGNLFSKRTSVEFLPDAPCPTWLAFLGRVMNRDNDLIAFLRRAVGYTLTGDASEQCLFVLLGNGANGKTTFLRTIRALLEDYAQQTPMDTLMVSKNTGVSNDLARLDKARFVSAVEAEHGKKLAETKIKQMTGGDPIAARYLYGEFFEFVPMFKLWLATNELPRIEGNDEGTWRRIRVVPFDVTIPAEERDGTLSAKLDAELPGILRWAVEGCLEWQREGGLRPPDKVMTATRAYRSDMDLLAQFLDDACIVEAGAQVTAKDLYVEYQDWCRANGHEAISQISLGHRLKAKGHRQVRDRHARGWAGLRLRNAADEVQAV